MYCRALGVAVFLLTPLLSYSQELKELQAYRAQVQDALLRVERGLAPCYTDECQEKKRQSLLRVIDLTNRLPSTKTFLPSKSEGLASGSQLLREKFAPPQMRNGYFPETLHEWSVWWQRRYSYEDQLRGSWTLFTDEVFNIDHGLQIFQALQKWSDDEKTVFQEAWDRGLSDAAFHLTRMNQLVREARMALNAGDKEKSSQLSARAKAQQESLRKVDERFRGHWKTVLQEIFPQLNESEAVAFLLFLDRWLVITDNNDIFSEANRRELTQYANRVKELKKSIQDFNDLEYGVIGIFNFYSSVNPAVAAEGEIPIQQFLDKFDSTMRIIVDGAIMYSVGAAAEAAYGATALVKIGIPTAMQLGLGLNDIDMSEALWPKSTRHHDLISTVTALEARMEQRLQTLMVARKALKEKIRILDLQIDDLKTLTNDETENEEGEP